MDEVQAEPPKQCWRCDVHVAVRAFATARFPELAKRVVFRLQRIEASGIYGVDRNYRSLWDEYRHQVQIETVDQLQSAWDSLLDPLLKAVIGSLPEHEASILTVGAAWIQDTRDEFDGKVAPDQALLAACLLDYLNREASGRLPDRLG